MTSSTLTVSSNSSALPVVNSSSNTSAASSTPPVISTPPSTPPSTVDPVAVALNKIFKESAVSKLWEEKVTKASNIFTQFAGLFVYLWNKGEAVAQDATIEKINVAVTQLVDSVAERNYSEEEAATKGLPRLRFTNAKDQEVYGARQEASNKALSEFYDLFKARVTQLGITEQSNDYGVYAAAASKAIQESSSNLKSFTKVGGGVVPRTIDTTATLKTKIETTVKGFNSKIFYDMVNSFADQPIENITIQGFKDKVVVLKGFFSSNDTVEIETELRKAIKAKHDSVQFNTIHTEFLNPAANAPRFVAARAAIETKLNAEKTALEADLNALRGPHGFDGTLNTAFQERQTAEAEKNQAYTALVTAFQQPTANLAVTDVNATLAAITAFLSGTSGATSNIAQIQGLLVTYQQKAAAFEAKKAAHDALFARLNEIATYNYGSSVVTGGKLHAVTTNLQTAALDNAARTEATKIANFFNELNQVVGDSTKIVRSNALRAIIGQ